MRGRLYKRVYIKSNQMQKGRGSRLHRWHIGHEPKEAGIRNRLDYRRGVRRRLRLKYSRKHGRQARGGAGEEQSAGVPSRTSCRSSLPMSCTLERVRGEYPSSALDMWLSRLGPMPPL